MKNNIPNPVYSVCIEYLLVDYLVLVNSNDTGSEVKSNVKSTFDNQMRNQDINLTEGILVNSVYYVI